MQEEPHPIVSFLNTIVPNGLAPREALDIIYKLKERKVNLLFFGNFYNMNFEEYYNGMLQVMDDRKFLYLSLLRDSYTQGVRLGQKYKMLKTAYNIFMYGLILAIVVFVIAYIISVSTNSPTTIDY